MNDLKQKIESKEITIGIIGLGYVGLPLAMTFVSKGFKVVGFDNDSNKINILKSKKSYLSHITNDVFQNKEWDVFFTPTSDFRGLVACDVIIICVPTPTTDTNEPDLSPVFETAETIENTLTRSFDKTEFPKLIVLESSTYPTTTRLVYDRYFKPHPYHILMAYSPEREDPGNKNFNTSTIPKLVGGLTPEATEVAELLYSKVISKVIPVSSAEVAEAAKMLENTFRAINIALINETKIVLDKMGIDIWEVIEAAKTKPFGYMPFYPGPGWGGHCLIPGTLVMMGDGSEKKIEDIQKSDIVMSGNGNKKKILTNMSRDYKGNIITLTGKGVLYDLSTTTDHKIFVSEWLHNQNRTKKVLGNTSMVPCEQLISYRKNKTSHRLHQLGKFERPEIDGNEDLASLLGFYLSEGWTEFNTTKTSKRISFAFHENEIRNHKKVSDLCKKLFDVETKQSRPHKGKCIVIRAYSTKLSNLMENLGSRLSWKKRLSPIVFSWSRKSLENLWTTWVDGDGHRTENQEKICTVSKQLARDMYRIGLMLGKSVSIYTQKTPGKRKIYWIVTLTHEYNYKNHRTVNLIKKTTKKYNGPVYNLEVEDDHSYIANTFVVSNCIPVDPFYLSYIAKKHGTRARFIELAGEINLHMPEYVVEKTVDGLGKTGKALNGSKILILGVAYKPDIADFRESPALRIIEILEQKGAKVDYHDPYVKEIPCTRHFSIQKKSIEDNTNLTYGYDAAIIVTNHSVYATSKYDFSKSDALIVDTRNLIKNHHNRIKA